jgi:hypothetical protein
MTPRTPFELPIEPKELPIEQFRQLGILREINRQFLHPLGLALSTAYDPKTGEEYLYRVLDYRDTPQGPVFADEVLDSDAVRDAADALELTRAEREFARKAAFGWVVQPIPEGGKKGG